MAVADQIIKPRYRTRGSDTQFARESLAGAIQLDERIRIEDQDLTGGTEFALQDLALDGDLSAWLAPIRGRRVFYFSDDLIQEWQRAVSRRGQEATSVRFVPSLEVALDGIRENLLKVISDAVVTWTRQPAVSTGQSALILDIPTVLHDARAKAGLPVQDVAAMFGVRRRQFYNLLNGDALPSPDTERRIAPVSEAIRVLAEAALGDSRAVRAAILARIDGDSVFDASKAGEPDRIEVATARAAEAVTRSQRLRKRLPPSHEATPEDAAVARAESRHSRDQMGFNAGGS